MKIKKSFFIILLVLSVLFVSACSQTPAPQDKEEKQASAEADDQNEDSQSSKRGSQDMDADDWGWDDEEDVDDIETADMNEEEKVALNDLTLKSNRRILVFSNMSL